MKLKTDLEMLPGTNSRRFILFIESKILTMADLGVIREEFDYETYEIGINCKEPEGTKVRFILIG